MIPIPPIATGQKIAVAEFVTLRTYTSFTDPGTLIAVSNWVQPITYQGVNFEPLGPFIGVGTQSRQLKTSQQETSLTIVGIDPAWVQRILSGVAKGGLVNVFRGFFDSNYNLLNATLYQRYAGIITSWTIQETFDDQAKSRTATLVISSSALDMLLDNKNGRFTNQQSWQAKGVATDTSMNRVAQLQNVYFNFGQKV